jgi:hypothetical protein
MHLGVALLQHVLVALFLIKFSRNGIFLATMADTNALKSLQNDESSGIDNTNNSNNNEEKMEIPALPALSNYAANEEDNVNVLTLDGDALTFERLGPMIINTDGTVRRIANWDILSPQEKESSWRLISARNRKRVEELKRKIAAGIDITKNETEEYDNK